jgi:hypothetical protein
MGEYRQYIVKEGSLTEHDVSFSSLTKQNCQVYRIKRVPALCTLSRVFISLGTGVDYLCTLVFFQAFLISNPITVLNLYKYNYISK